MPLGEFSEFSDELSTVVFQPRQTAQHIRMKLMEKEESAQHNAERAAADFFDTLAETMGDEFFAGAFDPRFVDHDKHYHGIQRRLGEEHADALKEAVCKYYAESVARNAVLLQTNKDIWTIDWNDPKEFRKHERIERLSHEIERRIRERCLHS